MLTFPSFPVLLQYMFRPNLPSSGVQVPLFRSAYVLLDVYFVLYCSCLYCFIAYSRDPMWLVGMSFSGVTMVITCATSLNVKSLQVRSNSVFISLCVSQTNEESIT
jgi:hypothetical protein